MATPQAARLIGIDRSERWIEEAKKLTDDTRVTFECVDVATGIPIADQSIDALYSVNLLECVPKKAELFAEWARVLRPGGSIVVAHFDWDTQTFDGEDRASVRKIVHAFNDWKQAWMEEIDPWAGRRLWRYFQANGSFEGTMKTYTLVDTSYAPSSYGRRQAESFEALVRRGLIPRDEYDAFIRDQTDAAERGEFFFSVTLFAFVSRRRTEGLIDPDQ
jgi:SAM-dependent methyltransferase